MKLKDYIKLDNAMDSIEEYDTTTHHADLSQPFGKNWVT